MFTPNKYGFGKFRLVSNSRKLEHGFYLLVSGSLELPGFPTRLPDCREKGVFLRPVDIEVLVHKNDTVLWKLRCTVHSA